MVNLINNLFGIKYPIVQAGMVWCSGWELASAVSEAGGLGLIGAGSMYPEVLRSHIRKCRAATSNSFGVNIPLSCPDIKELMTVIVKENVKIVFTSAGNPMLWTDFLKDHGICVAHVVSNTTFARKAEDAGVHAIVAEGFEAGGHNGREETATMCLVPMVCKSVSVPVLAAGGIGCGRGMLAAMALGAEGVQIGSRFAASLESSAHAAFKRAIVNAAEGDTKLSMKKLMPVRLLRNSFFEKVQLLEGNGASREELINLLGKSRAKKGMFEGDLEGGELEIGQVSAAIDSIKPAAAILEEIYRDFLEVKKDISKLDF